MKDQAFFNLIQSYLTITDGVSVEEVEKALRSHAKNWGGCISCKYSIAYKGYGKGNVWLQRGCQLGLSQGQCGMWKAFPEEVKNEN